MAQESENPRMDLAVTLIIPGVGFLLVALFAWWALASVEPGESVRLNILVAIPYRIGGPVFAVASFLVPGLALTGSGAYFFATSPK